MKRLRLLLADDHVVLLEGLQGLLARDFELAGTARDGREVLAEAARLQPDIVVLDISMPNLNGIEVARQLVKSNPNLRVVMLTMYADAGYLQAAFDAGAAGYVVKHAAATELVAAIHAVAEGGTYVSSQLRASAEPGAKAVKTGAHTLTVREREVLRLLAAGRSRKEIGQALTISVKTVEFHKHRIGQKLGIRTTAELTAYAIHHGIAGQ